MIILHISKEYYSLLFYEIAKFNSNDLELKFFITFTFSACLFLVSLGQPTAVNDEVQFRPKNEAVDLHQTRQMEVAPLVLKAKGSNGGWFHWKHKYKRCPIATWFRYIYCVTIIIIIINRVCWDYTHRVCRDYTLHYTLQDEPLPEIRLPEIAGLIN